MRVAVIYDDRDRPETTGGYCFRALRELVDARHVRPDQTGDVSPSDFDLFFRVDDGLDFELPSKLRPLAWWAIDTHLDLERCRRQARSADLTFAAQQPGAEAISRSGDALAEWLPLACDPSVHTPHRLAKRFDFSFVGNQLPGPRTELIQLLVREFPSHFVGRAYFDDMARVYSESRTTFNRSIRDDVNMRVFEAIACGSLLVTNKLPPETGQDELFSDGGHLATYQDPEELLDKIRFYLAHPESRTKIERAGQEEVVAKHTYRHRMERLLAASERLPVSSTIARPSDGPSHSDKLEYDPSYFEFARPELLELIPRAARDVVDVGCAAGRLGQALKARQTCRVVGIEQNPTAAAAARTRLDLVLEGDTENIDWPFSAESFDAVVCGDILEHLRDPLAFLRRVRTWLRLGGSLIVSLPNARNHTVVRSLLDGNWTYEPAGLLDHTHLRFFTRREIEKLLFRAGFEVPDLVPIGGPGYREWVAAGTPGQVAIGELRIAPIAPAEALEFYTYQWLAAARAVSRPEFGLTSIVILTHNQLPLTRCCIDSIRLLTDEPYELVLVDNGSTDGTPEYLKSLAAFEPRVNLILNSTNRGFPAGCNQGIRAARGANVLLLNNDTVVTTGWLSRLLQALHADPAIGLVGPCANRVSGPQQIAVAYSEDDLCGLDGFAWKLGRTQNGKSEETDRLVGFCLLMKRSVIDAVGGLDERFGIGNFEDDDYCRRAAQAGFKAVIARDAFIHHVGGATFATVGIDYEKLLNENARLFHEKWGEDKDPPRSSEPLVGSRRTDGDVPTTPHFTIRAMEGGGLLLERKQVLVSGCLIVRDNAATIRACLESLRPWVDELVVVDTGSTDDTDLIAKQCGARVFHFEWVDDFSAARNESIRHASGKWIFWMDSDDTLPPENGEKLREIARGAAPDTLGFVIDVHCPGASSDDDITVVTHVKLFRNRPDLRFEHRIHEQILPAINRAGGQVQHTGLYVVHSGYDHSPEGQVRKLDRDLRILHSELREQPNHPFTLFNLGMTYTDARRHQEALDYLEQCIAVSGERDSHVRKAFAYAVVCHQSLGNPDQALVVCEQGLLRFPLDAELRFRRGLFLQQAGRLTDAIKSYRDVLGNHEPPHFSSVVAGIDGHLARHNLAVVYEEAEEFAQAEEQWRLILAERPYYRPAWRSLGSLALRQGRLKEASFLASKMLAEPRLQAEGFLLQGRIAIAQRDTESTVANWKRVIELASNDRETLSEVARLLFDNMGAAAACSALEKLIQLVPDDAPTHHNLAAAYLERGDFVRASASCRTSLRLRPNSPATEGLLSTILKHQL